MPRDPAEVPPFVVLNRNVSPSTGFCFGGLGVWGRGRPCESPSPAAMYYLPHALISACVLANCAGAMYLGIGKNSNQMPTDTVYVVGITRAIMRAIGFFQLHSSLEVTGRRPGIECSSRCQCDWRGEYK
jgi:hypothetical protein